MDNPSAGQGFFYLLKQIFALNVFQAAKTVLNLSVAPTITTSTQPGLGTNAVASGAAQQIDTISASLSAGSYAKSGAGYAALDNTSIDLDLTAIAGMGNWSGDTDFATINELYITNLDPNAVLVVGDDGTAAEWYDWIGTTATVTVNIFPGETRRVYCAAGLAVSGAARHKLKFASTSATGAFCLALGGA